MNILLMPNSEKERSAACTAEIAAELVRLGLTPMLDAACPLPMPEQRCVRGEYEDLLLRGDLLMPIGGDGTLMRAARDTVHTGKPILGVNTGRVGFLTQMESDELEKLALLRDGKYTLSNRMMLEGVLSDGGENGEETRFSALNDISVSRGDMDNIADMEVSEGDRLVTRQRGDGLIFATPTGSTAYSLSAGGPIVDPELELFLLTAICPHATFRCSLALPCHKIYTVREHGDHRGEGLAVTADGTRIAVMRAGQSLLIRKSGYYVRLADFGLHDFYDRLSEKLSWRR